MKPVLGIVTVGAANRRSIEAALVRAGAQTRFVTVPGEMTGCDALVLPGVANFGYVARELDTTGLRAALLDAVERGTPLLGICVGYQLLFERSEEAPLERGLGIFSGTVRRLTTPRVPHMGWNRVESCSRLESGWAYFANSYAPDDGVDAALATTTDGNTAFASAAERGDVLGMQFHPERSAAYGARLLEQFVESAARVYAG
jgi:imidazole glycerol-phosphate synthase subunit HisH